MNVVAKTTGNSIDVDEMQRRGIADQVAKSQSTGRGLASEADLSAITSSLENDLAELENYLPVPPRRTSRVQVRYVVGKRIPPPIITDQELMGEG